MEGVEALLLEVGRRHGEGRVNSVFASQLKFLATEHLMERLILAENVFLRDLVLNVGVF